MHPDVHQYPQYPVWLYNGGNQYPLLLVQPGVGVPPGGFPLGPTVAMAQPPEDAQAVA